jgi:hypothetical protein
VAWWCSGAGCVCAYSELALDAHAEVLVEPYRNGGTGLEELEDEVDWGQEDCDKSVVGACDAAIQDARTLSSTAAWDCQLAAVLCVKLGHSPPRPVMLRMGMGVRGVSREKAPRQRWLDVVSGCSGAAVQQCSGGDGVGGSSEVREQFGQ